MSEMEWEGVAKSHSFSSFDQLRSPQLRTLDYFDESDLYASPSNSSDGINHRKALQRPGEQVVPNNLLMVTMLEMICDIYEKNDRKKKKLVNLVAEQLAKMNVLSNVFYQDEFSTIRSQYRNAFTKIMRSTVEAVRQEGNLLALPCNSHNQVSLLGNSLHLEKRLLVNQEDLLSSFNSRYAQEFEELGKLGKGGYGSVFKVKNKIDGKEYAVKKIRLKETDPDICRKILREVQLLASLQHHHIVGYNAAWLETLNIAELKNNSTSYNNLAAFEMNSFTYSSDGIYFEASKSQEESETNDSVHISSSPSSGSTTVASSNESTSEQGGSGTPLKLLMPIHESQTSRSPRDKNRGRANKEKRATKAIEIRLCPLCHKNSGGCPHQKPKFVLGEETPMDYSLPDEGGGGDSSGSGSRSSSSSSGGGERAASPVEMVGTNTAKNGQFGPASSWIFGARNPPLLLKQTSKDMNSGSPPFYRSQSWDTSHFNREKHVCNSHCAEEENSIDGIVNSLDFGLVLHIQMQLCNRTLRDWLSERNLQVLLVEDQFSLVNLPLAMRLLRQILEGVEYIHSHNLMHRDIKPRNIFLEGNELHIRIGDFGLARNDSFDSTSPLTPTPGVVVDHILDESGHTSGVGTCTYASPEQLNGSSYDSKSDLYSVGIILFEVLHPFGTEMERVKCLSALRNGAPSPEIKKRYPDQSNIIKKLLSENPLERPTTKELLSTLFCNKDETIRKLEKKLCDQDRELFKLRKQLQEKEELIRKLQKEL